VSSTQDSLRKAFEKGEAEHLVICADYQEEARGRHGRKWNQKCGEDLALSVLLTPKDRYPPLLLPFLFPATLFETLLNIGIPGSCLRIKWPNDLLIREKKLAGVLVEGDGSGTFLCGIGCNVARRSFPRELKERASSLALEGWDRIGYPDLLEAFLPLLAQRVSEAEKGDWNKTLASYQKGFCLVGKELRMETSGGEVFGKLAEMGPNGIILEGGRRFSLGEVQGIQSRFPN
jgi:BirA family biotin operon repressor/biotin-[acetyl-CoA-carboxylase] ligase